MKSGDKSQVIVLIAEDDCLLQRSALEREDEPDECCGRLDLGANARCHLPRAVGAVLVNNIGAWMQTVGAQWLLVDLPNAALLVALVQTADMLPDVLLAYVGGVIADIFDRRLLLIVIQAFLVVTGLVLTILTIAGQMPPALLLTLTFLLGAGSALAVPAYQAMIPDLVPRSQLSSASALGSINVNLARVIGPALAGLVIAKLGLGRARSIRHIFHLWSCAHDLAPLRSDSAPPERFAPALRAGGAVCALLSCDWHSGTFGLFLVGGAL
jgi:MFS family permease